METDNVRLVLVIEETHTFLPRKVGKDAKEKAKEVQRLIEKIVREKAKYGVVVILVTYIQHLCEPKFTKFLAAKAW